MPVPVRQPRAAASYATALAVPAAAAACADPTAATGPGARRAAIAPRADRAADTLTVGDTTRFEGWLVNPAGDTLPHDKKVAWASSDPAVATVDAAGVVTAVGKGR
jgi:hypothetical protein